MHGSNFNVNFLLYSERREHIGNIYKCRNQSNPGAKLTIKTGETQFTRLLESRSVECVVRSGDQTDIWRFIATN